MVPLNMVGKSANWLGIEDGKSKTQIREDFPANHF
jgi:hypothetical protein